jgi:hypothetical protein
MAPYQEIRSNPSHTSIPTEDPRFEQGGQGQPDGGEDPDLRRRLQSGNRARELGGAPPTKADDRGILLIRSDPGRGVKELTRPGRDVASPLFACRWRFRRGWPVLLQANQRPHRWNRSTVFRCFLRETQLVCDRGGHTRRRPHAPIPV